MMPNHPLYPPPPFVDETYFHQVEQRAKAAEDYAATIEMEGGDVPEELHELVTNDVPALIEALRRKIDVQGRH